MDNKQFKISILGAGVVGLTTALKLQNSFNNINLTIIAENFNERTTSHGAAGIFRPSTNFLVANNVELTRKCIKTSYNYYVNLLIENCGVKNIDGYIFSKIDPLLVRNHFLEGLVNVYRPVTEDELNLCPGGWKFGSYFTTLLIECKYYLPWALNKFKRNGGQVIVATLNKLEDLKKYGQFDVLMNCSGIGAKKLFNDHKVVPIRGQIFKIKAPSLNKFYYGDFDTYIIPGAEGFTTLGGSRHYESWRTDICNYDLSAIWTRCTNLLPKLLIENNSEIVNCWAGLRPHRDSGVRIESEIINGLKIIHNYGHGGYGVTSAPGTADMAIELLTEMLKYNISKL